MYFFQWTEVYESFQQVLLLKRTLYGLTISANVTNLTIQIANCVHCYSISASSCGYHAVAMAGDAFVSALWRANVYVAIMARWLFGVAELEI